VNRVKVTLLFLLAASVIGGAGACSIPIRPTTGIETSPVRFTENDRALIREYYSNFEFPPELEDPSVIAPGLKQRLELSATLPPDIAAFPLPLELQEQLASIPPGYERFRTGQDVVLMDVRTRQVVDIVINVFSPALAPPAQ
jgi:hypothetical protein